MSVIGIDFGNESCYVAVARAGGIETIANDYSLRSTPSCVAFSTKNRILGVAAKNQMVTNMKNTVHGFKRLLGRSYSDPYVEQELKYLPFKCVQNSTGGIGIEVNFLDDIHVFSPEQVTGMLMTKLKDIAETALKTKVNDCVISVPSYFTNNERKALLDAAAISGLNVLRLFNETTATALAYGIYKQDLPEDKPRNVVFVDCGHASLQVSACAFHKGKLKMLASASDVSLGGRDIDALLAGYFADDFVKRYHIDARKNPRAWLRLTAEVEKIKKQMSANSTKLPLNIECFMDDKDVHGDMCRADMENLCGKLFERVEVTLRKCLEDSKLRLEEIYAVEVVGGSSRIPAIKQLIEQIFHVPASTTLNQDEAVSRGCALQCAMLSPAIRVRDFSVTDIQNYPVKLIWDQQGEEGDLCFADFLHGKHYQLKETLMVIQHIGQDESIVEVETPKSEMEIFSQNHAVPFSKMLTFFRKETFSVKAYYSGITPYPDPYVGEYIVRDVKPTAEGECQKVKIKVRVNLNGILSVTSASLVEKLTASEQQLESSPADEATSESMDTEPDVNQSQENAKNHEDDGEPVAHVENKKDKKRKQMVKVVELPIESIVAGFSPKEIDNLHELECKMISGDRQEKERIDARNALEEYVYDVRGKLSSEEELVMFVAEVPRTSLGRELDATETWLYEEGEDCPRNVYVDRLSKLKVECEPIKHRRLEFDGRSSALDEFAALIQLTNKAVDAFRSGNERFSHISAEDMNKVVVATDNAFKWLEDARSSLAATPLFVDAPYSCAKLREEKHSLENLVNPIINKPKPAPAPAPPVDETTSKKPEDVATAETGCGDINNRPTENAPEEVMDVE